jgi:hypothetical protein
MCGYYANGAFWNPNLKWPTAMQLRFWPVTTPVGSCHDA